jgi:hypothetical protein
MLTNIETYSTSEVIKQTGYSRQYLSELRASGVAGKEGEEWYYRAGTSYYTKDSLQKILEFKRTAKERKGGRPKKISSPQKTS